MHTLTLVLGGEFLTSGAELWDFNTLIELCWISRVPPAVDVTGRDFARAKISLPLWFRAADGQKFLAWSHGKIKRVKFC